MHTTTINIQNAESAHVGKLKTFPGSETHGPFFIREIVVACDGGGRTVIKLFSDTPEGCDIHGLLPTPEITRDAAGTLTSKLPPMPFAGFALVTDDVEASLLAPDAKATMDDVRAEQAAHDNAAESAYLRGEGFEPDPEDDEEEDTVTLPVEPNGRLTEVMTDAF